MTFWFFWNVNKNSLQIYKYTEVSLPIPMIVIKKALMMIHSVQSLCTLLY